MADTPWYQMTPEKQKLMQNQTVLGNVKYQAVPAPPTAGSPAQQTNTSTPSVPTASVPTPPTGNNQKVLQDYGQRIQNGEVRWGDSSKPGYTSSVRDANFSAFMADPKHGSMYYDDWLDKNLPKPAAAATPVVPASVPTSSVPTPPGTIDADRIAREAKAKMDKQIAERARIAAQTKQGFQSTYDKLKTTIGEDRALQNAQMQNRLDPFNKRSDYERGMIAMNRERSDREMNQDLAARMGNVDAQLADFMNLAPEQQQALENELTRMEREYGLQVGSLMGSFNGQRTLAGSAQDANYTGYYGGQRTMQAQNQDFQQQLAMADLMGQYNGQSTLAGKQANWNAYKDSVDMTGNLGNGPKQDWGQYGIAAGEQSYRAKQDAIKNGQWQQQFDYGKQMDSAKMQQDAQRFAQQMGIDYARLNQSQQQFMQEMAFKQQQPAVQSMKSTDYKTSPDFAQDVQDLKSMDPTQAQKILNQQAQVFIATYGYDGYNALMNMFKDQ